MKITGSILFTFVFYFTALAQEVSNWKTYSSMSEVRDIFVLEDKVSAATSGGAFLYTFSDNSFRTLTKSETMTGISLTATSVDGNGNIWFGSSTGAVDIYNPAENSIKSISEIFNSDKPVKQINEIKIYGDTAIVSTDFGISLINTGTYDFLDTPVKFGSLPSNIKVNSSLKTDVIYACTDFGIAIQKAGRTNLLDPESWDVYTSSQGLPSDKVFKVINFQNNIIAATEKGLAVFNGQLWTPFLPGLNESIDLLVNAGTLYILSSGAIRTYTNGEPLLYYQAQYPMTKLGYSSKGLFAASSNGVLKINSGTDAEVILVNGPPANKFPEISIDNNGTLWSASGRDGGGAGFYKLENGVWTNYNTVNTPQLRTNDVYTTYSAPDNTTYLGTWGSGFIRVKGEAIDVFTAENTGMNGIDNDPDFLVIRGFGVDSRQNLWVLNYWPTDRRTLSMLTTDNVWHHFRVPAEDNVSRDQHLELVVDQYDTKWFTLQTGRPGLYFFNENKTYDNTSDDRSGYIYSSNGLNSNIVNSIIIDRRGDLWVGTASGVNVISNLQTVSQGAQLRITSVFALRQQTVNCIAVDPLNQKWIGTNQGILLVNSDGSSLLTSFNTRNSPILSDIIRSIVIDENSGVVYVGTDAGITSFQTLSIKPQDTFSELFIYPSPFILKSSDNLLTIDGLIRDTDIKILTANGKLISEFTSPGGLRATWDGRDTDGKLVSSGVYFVIAYDKEGNNVSTSKVAVLRE
ncbi:MAG: two-component regulator propeller domain-containing protein [Ignavibacteriaceae bacterium]